MGVILASCERQLTFPALLIEIELCSLRAGLCVQSRLRGVHCESGVEHGVLETMNAMLSARIVRGSLTGLIFVIRFSLLLFVNMKSFFFILRKWMDGLKCCFVLWILFLVYLGIVFKLRFSAHLQDPVQREWMVQRASLFEVANCPLYVITDRPPGCVLIWSRDRLTPYAQRLWNVHR